MVRIRKSADRGHRNHGWLDTFHTFSFGDYHDADHMGFRSLRVINEDVVDPAKGFGTHPHRDMEIVTYVLSGALAHKDSLGNGSTIRPGDVQRMTAGTGVLHSEFNASDTEPTHLLQIWILPERGGLAPGYEQVHVEDDALQGALTPIAGPPGAQAAVTVHQDAWIHAGRFEAGQSVHHDLAPGRGGWLQVARGVVRLGEHELTAGDGAAIEGMPRIDIEVLQDAEVLLFDLA